MNAKQKLHQLHLQQWTDRFQGQASNGLSVKDPSAARLLKEPARQKPRAAYLRIFLINGDVPMNNNTAERTIRPFTIGRNYVLKNISARTG